MSEPITYLATHLPAVSHTFIVDEIDALESLGVVIKPVSINPISEADRLSDPKQRHRTTTYLKSLSKWRVVAAVASTTVRHPSVITIPWLARGSGPRVLLWRYFQLAEAIMVFRLMRRAGSRHVHAHFGQAPATIAWFATEVARRHRSGRMNTWSVTIHGWHEFADERASKLREKVAAAEFVVCVSDYTRAQLFRIADAEHRAKIHVIRCGVRLAHFAPRPRQPANTPPRLAIVARVSPEKGHLVLIDAIAMLRARGLELGVDVIGPEPDGFGDVVRRYAEASGAGDSFVWHGAMPPQAVAEQLAQADVFCLPSFAEGLPVTIMEAMASAVPVVTTYVGGIPELAVDHVSALVVPAARADLLAEALEEILNDHALCSRLVASATALVHEHHDIEQNVKMLAQLFGHREGAHS